ncbi:MAG: J domain-containing protein [Verrucomicrobiota bacterium]
MDEISTCYRILDLEPGASLEEVKRSYRELVKVWHPDRFRGDPKLQAKAEEKLKRINLAYERLCHETAASAGHRTASSQPPRPEPERTRSDARADHAHSEKSTQTHAPEARPRSAPAGRNNGEVFRRWIRKPWVISALVAFVLIGIGMLVVSYRSGPRNEKFEQLLKAATQGDTGAQIALGDLYYYGEGVPKDDAKSVKWYEKAGNQGDANAQKHLVVFYENGWRVEKDLAKAAAWNEKIAAQGDATAKKEVADWYGYFLEDDAKVAEWYEKAAAQGDTIALKELARKFADGKGIPKNEAKATKWYQKAAAQGDDRALTELAERYSEGSGVPKDLAKAARWYEAAADCGDSVAKRNMGYKYAFGEGVPVDETKAFEWYHKAALLGDNTAQLELGQRYADGRGVSKDKTKADEWLEKAVRHPEFIAWNARNNAEIVERYQKAADKGDAEAQFQLGRTYEFGLWDVSQDRAKAAECFHKAAEQGHAAAKDKLKFIFAKSEGVPNRGAQSSPITFASLPPTGSLQKTDEAMLRHLATDDRLTSGSLLADQLRKYSGKGKLTLDNGLPEDAYVKLVSNGKLVAAFYVRSHEKFTYSTIPDGSYSVIYCTGYGWDGTVRNFARGRHARRYDKPLDYSTKQARDSLGVTTYTDVVTLTLHKVIGGSAKASDMALEDFDRY